MNAKDIAELKARIKEERHLVEQEYRDLTSLLNIPRSEPGIMEKKARTLRYLNENIRILNSDSAKDFLEKCAGLAGWIRAEMLMFKKGFMIDNDEKKKNSAAIRITQEEIELYRENMEDEKKRPILVKISFERITAALKQRLASMGYSSAQIQKMIEGISRGEKKYLDYLHNQAVIPLLQTEYGLAEACAKDMKIEHGLINAERKLEKELTAINKSQLDTVNLIRNAIEEEASGKEIPHETRTRVINLISRLSRQISQEQTEMNRLNSSLFLDRREQQRIINETGEEERIIVELGNLVSKSARELAAERREMIFALLNNVETINELEKMTGSGKLKRLKNIEEFMKTDFNNALAEVEKK